MGTFEELSFSFAEGGTCVNGKLCYESFQCARRPEINSAGDLVVHVLHKIDPCEGATQVSVEIESSSSSL